MPDYLKKEFADDLKELNRENRKSLIVLIGILWFISTAMFGWIASDWNRRMDGGEQLSKQLVDRQAKAETEIALLKGADSSHDKQLDVLTRASEVMQRNHSDMLQQMTEVRIGVTTIKETTKSTSDRVEGLTKYLRDSANPKGSILDNSDQRRYRGDLP